MSFPGNTGNDVPDKLSRNRNFLLYFFGQALSLPGTFVQATAQAWLVLELTHSGTALGWIIGLQFGPMLLFGAQAGVLVDRFDRRRLYLVTQTISAVHALVLAVLTFTGHVEVWILALFAAVLGLITAVDQPTKSAMVLDVVGPRSLQRGIGANNALANLGRVVGPAIAGLLIATVGVAYCFAINGLSYLAVVAALLVMRPSDMYAQTSAGRGGGQFREGLAYVRMSPGILCLLIFAPVFFGIAWQYDVTIPLLAKQSFSGGPELLALLLSAFGAGAVLGVVLDRRRPTHAQSDKGIMTTGIAFGLITILTAMSPNVVLTVLGLALSGAAGISLVTALSCRLQLEARPEMRGRVIALWSVAVLGTRPIFSPIAGWVSELTSPRVVLGSGAVTIVLLGVVLRWYRTRDHGGEDPDPSSPEDRSTMSRVRSENESV